MKADPILATRATTVCVQKAQRRLNRIALLSVVAVLAVLPRLCYGHPLLASLAVGTRTFEKRLDLEPDAAIAARIGAGLNDRMSVYLEYLYSVPSRKTTGSSASVTVYRLIGRATFTSWTLKPYAEIGFGGVLFDFRDAYDTAAATLMTGAGLGMDTSHRSRLFAEASVDFYRYRAVTYDDRGQELFSTARSTDNMGTFLVGMQVSF